MNWIIGALTTLLLSIPLVLEWSALEVLRLKTFDALVPDQVPSGNFSVLDITEEDVAREGGWPFPRDRLAEIQENLMSNGALGVGWVIAFPQPDRFGGDKEFAESLSSSPSVLAMFENETGGFPPTIGTVTLGEDKGGYLAAGVIENIELLSVSAEQGLAVAPVDVDQLVRRIPLLLRTPDGWIASFGTQVLKVLVGADTYLIKTNENGIQEIRVRGLPAVPTDSLGRKWISWVNTPEFTLNELLRGKADIEGKFVFVGVTAQGVMPQVATPVGLLEPHKIQAALSESILIQDSPHIPDYALAVELLIFFLGVVLIWACLSFLGITSGLVSGMLLLGSTAYLGTYFVSSGLLIDVTWALISEFIAATVTFYLRFRQQFKLRQEIKKQFEHYLDPRQVKQLQKNPQLLKLGGEKRYATFLFTDVRGFTSLSESVEPEQVTYIMNKALTAQQAAVQKHSGMVDKYIGDAMMAIFNAPLDLPEHENIAIKCAKDILLNMQELNTELEKEGLPSVAIGIGVNSGDAIIGNMGSQTRFDYTAIGDAVNTAARLESATKDVGEDILIGFNTKKSCSFELKLLEPIKVKGKEKLLQIYTVEA
jgi:adenylate cyclase